MFIVSGDFNDLLSGDVCLGEFCCHLEITCFSTDKYRWCMTSDPTQDPIVRWEQCGSQFAHNSFSCVLVFYKSQRPDLVIISLAGVKVTF